jgi:hypothetical protein
MRPINGSLFIHLPHLSVLHYVACHHNVRHSSEITLSLIHALPCCTVISMEPEQITLGTLKLTIENLPEGPIIELTDFETDVTWLSGSIYARLKRPDSEMVKGLKSISWEAKKDIIKVQGLLDNLNVAISYRLVENPDRLEERIEIFNPCDTPSEHEYLRVGSTWSPPLSWWAPWSDWGIIMIPEGYNSIYSDIATVGGPFSMLTDVLEPERFIEDARPVISDDVENAGWVVSDEKRFNAIAKLPQHDNEFCPLDIYHILKQPWTLVTGGIEYRDRLPLDLEEIKPQGLFKGGPTIFIPGIGSWQEALESYWGILKNTQP